jgi:tRNA(Ile)-lysidine synthase TilS/MesJ
MLMAKLFQELLKHDKFHFELVFLCMDPGYSEDNRRIIENNGKLLGIPLTIFETDIFSSVYNIENSPCYLCARMRRGHLYAKARELGCNKIALGHHYDDAVETLLMNLLFEGRIGCFQPVTYLSRMDVLQIRPMLYVKEQQIIRAAARLDLPVVHNPCPANGFTRRQEVKELLVELQRRYPDLKQKIFGAMQRYPLYGWEPGAEGEEHHEG